MFDSSIHATNESFLVLQETKRARRDERTTQSRDETMLKRSPSPALRLEEVGFISLGLSLTVLKEQMLHRCCCMEAQIYTYSNMCLLAHHRGVTNKAATGV